jgi:hypothetical protein
MRICCDCSRPLVALLAHKVMRRRHVSSWRKLIDLGYAVEIKPLAIAVPPGVCGMASLAGGRSATRFIAELWFRVERQCAP